MADLDGPRLEPRARQCQATRRVPARLWRRRQRPDRHRPCLAGAVARRCVRLAARARALRPGADRTPMVSADVPRSQRALAGRQQGAPVLNAFLDAELTRRKLPPSALALVGFSQGTMMALHVGLRRAVAPAAIVGYSGMLVTAGRSRARSNLPREIVSRPPVLLVHGDQDHADPGAGFVAGRARLGRAGRPGRVAYLARHRPWHRPGGPAARRRVSGARRFRARRWTYGVSSRQVLHNLVTLPYY